MIKREKILHEIELHKDSPLVKVVTGIRHSGKSCVFSQFIGKLKESGISGNHIIYFNFDSSEYASIRSATQIDNIIASKAREPGKYYLLFDEIQKLSGWEDTVESLLKMEKFDIYIASSNANVLPEKTPQTMQKWVNINFKPFSFYEYNDNIKLPFTRGRGLLQCAISIRNSSGQKLCNYVLDGGFPSVFMEKPEAKKKRLQDIYSLVIFRDVVQKNKIKNFELLEGIIKVIFENIGCENSAEKIKTALQQQSHRKNLSLVGVYIKYLEDAFILRRIRRYNIRSGKIVPTNVRYFIEDHSLLNASIAVCNEMHFGIYQNIILNDLLGRKLLVYSGKFYDHLIDFVAMNEKRIIFIQLVYGENDWKRQFEEKITALRALESDMNSYIDHTEKAMYVVFINCTTYPQSCENYVTHLKVQDYLLCKTL
ncbi:MAG: ATP-binding protein [Termitinemataceae bacterium]|nr:MAG: ATP-binding protein [Termitinemataceae bacterium]